MATAGAVLATVLGSYMGIAGTITGIALGSLVSGTISWWLERVIRRSAAKAEAQASAVRAWAGQRYPGGYGAIIWAAGRGRARRWAGPALARIKPGGR